MKFPICYVHDCSKQAGYYLIKQRNYIWTNDFQYKKANEPYEYEDANVVPLIEPTFVEKKIKNALESNKEFDEYLRQNWEDNKVVQDCKERTSRVFHGLLDISVNLTRPCEENKYIKFFKSLGKVAIIEDELTKIKLYDKYTQAKNSNEFVPNIQTRFQTAEPAMMMDDNDFYHSNEDRFERTGLEEKKESEEYINEMSNESYRNMSKERLLMKLEQKTEKIESL